MAPKDSIILSLLVNTRKFDFIYDFQYFSLASLVSSAMNDNITTTFYTFMNAKDVP